MNDADTNDVIDDEESKDQVEDDSWTTTPLPNYVSDWEITPVSTPISETEPISRPIPEPVTQCVVFSACKTSTLF